MLTTQLPRSGRAGTACLPLPATLLASALCRILLLSSLKVLL